MGPNEGYVISIILAILAFLLSFIVFRFFKKKWCLGCFLQLIVFCILFFAFNAVYIFISCGIGESGAMVCVEHVSEDRYCRFKQTFWIKTDGTYYYEFDKGSHEQSEEPCGNDSWSDKGTYSRIESDSINGIKTHSNPNIEIYFDIKKQEVTPLWDGDTLEVLSADWERIKEYFKQNK